MKRLLIRLAWWYLRRTGHVVMTAVAYRSVVTELTKLRGDRVVAKHIAHQRRAGYIR